MKLRKLSSMTWDYKPKTPTPHGTSGGYTNHHCRCNLCKQAFASQKRKWYHSSVERASYHKQKAANEHYLKKGAQGSCSVQQKLWRIEMWNFKCWICGNPYEVMDHVKPLSKGGSNWPSNQRPACVSCNGSKSNKWPYPSLV